MNKKEFFDDLKEFDKFDYTRFSKDWVMIYVVDILIKNKIEPLLDEISVASFKIFPRYFSLISFPQYPDVRTVANTLWHCKDKHKAWLSGNDKSGYKLSDKGKTVLESFLNEKTQFTKKEKYDQKPNRKELFFINEIKRNEIFKQFLKDSNVKIERSQIYNIAMCTKEASNKVVLENINNLKNYASRLNEKEVLKFLELIEDRFKK